MYPCVHTLSSTRTGLHHAGVHALHEAAPHSIVSHVFSPVQVQFRGGHGLGSGGHGRGVGPNKAHVEEQLRSCWLHLCPLTQLHCIPPHHLLCMLQLGGLLRLQGRHASLRQRVCCDLVRCPLTVSLTSPALSPLLCAPACWLPQPIRRHNHNHSKHVIHCHVA